MSVLEVLKFPDPRLRQRGEKVAEITSELKTLAEDMLATMYASNGVGLAAIQVGRNIQLLVADTRSELEKNENEENRYEASSLKQDLVRDIPQPICLFNPEIVKKEGEVIFAEGCLSFPSYFAEVKRAAIVEVRGLNEKGEEIFIRTDGLLSVCLQHEIDHLYGRLFIDHLSPIKAEKLRSEIKKYGYPEDSKTKDAL